MAFFEFWRDVSVGSPFDSITRYRYDTDTDVITPDTFNVPTGNLGVIHPAAGTNMWTMCATPAGSPYAWDYLSTGSSAALTKVVTFNPGCCALNIADFAVNRTNNTDPLSANGTIVVTGVGLVDINDYEATIDGGTTWVSPTAGAITFNGLAAGNYTVIVRLTGDVCTASTPITITDQFTYPPLIANESSQPDLYSPVFWPIVLGFTLANNTVNVKSDINGTYLEALTTDSAEYLANGGAGGGFPIIKIIDNVDYQGKYQILSRSTPGDPPDVGTKFYIDADYTTDQLVYFVPFERQVFYLYAEKSFNVYSKVAEISTYPDADSTVGEYKLRLEGFLQSTFEVNAPVNNGTDFSLLRKYYVVPRDFDSPTPPTVFNAVYSAAKTLTPFLDSLIPLGPAPINFINEQTQFGLPVIFSYIDLATGRVVNITSSQETDIVSTAPVVYVPGLPLNQYDVTWINPDGPIASPSTWDPPLPDWITWIPDAIDRVVLHIDLAIATGGDYDLDDYVTDDYLIGGANAVVGCYEFAFIDATSTQLFTLRICAFPIEKVNYECADPESFNISWVNLEGGRSSYIFSGQQTKGVDVGSVKTFKKSGVIKRAAVEDLYNSATVTVAAVSKKDLDFIASLRKSIQAYLYSQETQSWSIPILIDSRSFDLYTIPFEQIQAATGFSFKYAEEIRVQTQ